nr:hypothetical protein [Tanacetum cinerariifolium]
IYSLYPHFIMVNLPPPNNDPNVPEGDQALAIPNGFAPQWIGEHDSNNNNGWIEWDVPLGEKIHPRVATVEEQVQVMESQAVQVLRTRVVEMESHVGILMSYMLWIEEHLTVLEKRLPGPPPGPQ